MDKRKLGRTGFEIAPLAFGGNVFGWTVDEPTSFELLDRFLASGFNFIDTADVYSKWAPGKKVVIATKVGSEMAPGSKGLSRTYIVRAVEDSLKRLQTDYIDLYQSHID